MRCKYYGRRLSTITGGSGNIFGSSFLPVGPVEPAGITIRFYGESIMLKHKLLACASVALCFAFVSDVRAQVLVGDRPVLRGMTLDNARLGLDDFRGKMVLVDFWATWCGPCVRSMPKLKETYEKYKAQGLVVLGVSMDDGPALPARFCSERGIPWPSIMDQNGISRNWGVTTIPHMFIISPDGVVLWTGHPALADKEIEDAMKAHPPRRVDPKTLTSARETLAGVDAALSDNKPMLAIRAMAKIPEQASLDPEFRTKLTETQSKLDAQTDKMLSEVDTLVVDGKYGDAADRLRDLIRSAPGTPVAIKARAQLEALSKDPGAQEAMGRADREDKAAAAFTIAQKLVTDKKDDLAYARFKDIARDFSDTRAGADSSEKVKVYEADATFMRRVTESTVGTKARSALSLARSYANAGRTELAKKKYQEVINDYPNTKFADEAKTEMGKL